MNEKNILIKKWHGTNNLRFGLFLIFSILLSAKKAVINSPEMDLFFLIFIFIITTKSSHTTATLLFGSLQVGRAELIQDKFHQIG